MRIYFIVFVWSLLLAGQAEASQNKTCTREEAIQSETEASTLSDWDAVFVSFKHFAHCDDGAIWEGYSDAVVRLLARDWEHFDRLLMLISSNKKFEHFIIRHIDETVPADELQQIIENASVRCSSKGKRLCKQIEAAARLMVARVRRTP